MIKELVASAVAWNFWAFVGMLILLAGVSAYGIYRIDKEMAKNARESQVAYLKKIKKEMEKDE